MSATINQDLHRSNRRFSAVLPVFDTLLQSILQGHGWFVSKCSSWFRDVRHALIDVTGAWISVCVLRRGVSNPPNRRSEVGDTGRGPSADIERLADGVGCRSTEVCVHYVRDIDEIPSLGAVAVDRDRLIGERLLTEDQDDDRVITTRLSGAIDVEMSGRDGFDTIETVIQPRVVIDGGLVQAV